MFPSIVIFGIILSAFAAPTHAALKTQIIEYKEGDTVLEGYLAYDSSGPAHKPGIVVIHDWLGIGPYSKSRAEQLAKLGYVAFAADIYGKGARPSNPKEAGEKAGSFKSNRPLLRARVQAALAELKKQKRVDSKKLAAIGYCFGGTTALELARSGADVRGVVSFHGGLGSPTPTDASQIKGSVLVLHGADDPYVPEDEVKAFETEMRNAKIDWQIVKYANSVHSFTNPDAGNDNSKGAAYNATADKRSWIAMRDFFDEIFK